MDGQMMEVGPFRVGESGILYENPGSWHQFTNLLFGMYTFDGPLENLLIDTVDNPLGTGFSYVDTDSYIHDLPEVWTIVALL